MIKLSFSKIKPSWEKGARSVWYVPNIADQAWVKLGEVSKDANGNWQAKTNTGKVIEWGLSTKREAGLVLLGWYRRSAELLLQALQSEK